MTPYTYDAELARFKQWFSRLDLGPMESHREFLELYCWQASWEAADPAEALEYAKQAAMTLTEEQARAFLHHYRPVGQDTDTQQPPIFH